MPSPFPGMDPYLEGPRWLGLHNQLVPEFARQLSPKLLPRYYAETTERFLYAEPDDIAISTPIYSDVSIRTLENQEPFETAGIAVAGRVQLTAVMLGYQYSTDYSGPPPVPLPEADRTWADERLRLAGVRK